jgi:hypothetical protein
MALPAAEFNKILLIDSKHMGQTHTNRIIIILIIIIIII